MFEYVWRRLNEFLIKLLLLLFWWLMLLLTGWMLGWWLYSLCKESSNKLFICVTHSFKTTGFEKEPWHYSWLMPFRLIHAFKFYIYISNFIIGLKNGKKWPRSYTLLTNNWPFRGRIWSRLIWKTQEIKNDDCLSTSIS